MEIPNMRPTIISDDQFNDALEPCREPVKNWAPAPGSLTWSSDDSDWIGTEVGI